MRSASSSRRTLQDTPEGPMTHSIGWNADGVDGNPSSIDVLLGWLACPGNAQRWLESSGLQDGSRFELVSEMHDLFQSYGLTHRTRHSIVAKFWHFEQQLNKVERLLREEGLTHFDVNGETQRAVLKMCPYYRQLAPALRPSWLLRPQHYSSSGDMESDAQSESTEDGEVETWASSSVQRAPSMDPKSKNGRAHPQKIEYAYNSAVAIRWDSDAANGRPSSLDVLLEWLVVPGNAERWCVASGKHDGSQSILACEVYDLLLVHGITYRSRRSVVRKLRWWEEQFDKAESLLKKSGIQRFDDSAEAKRMVLRICPAYPKITHVLRSARQSVATASSRPGRSTSKDVRYPAAARKSATPRAKRARSLSPQREDAVDARGAVVLNAEPQERREFFKLELQVKRDQAICTRAKARKELFDLGMSREDVDRLLPL